LNSDSIFKGLDVKGMKNTRQILSDDDLIDLTDLLGYEESGVGSKPGKKGTALKASNPKVVVMAIGIAIDNCELPMA
jgi:hypothetical protein